MHTPVHPGLLRCGTRPRRISQGMYYDSVAVALATTPVRLQTGRKRRALAPVLSGCLLLLLFLVGDALAPARAHPHVLYTPETIWRPLRSRTRALPRALPGPAVSPDVVHLAPRPAPEAAARSPRGLFAPAAARPLPRAPAAAADDAVQAAAGARTFLALGDSYTIGESVPREGAWPQQLVARLKDKGVVVGKLDVVARTGWRTDDLRAAVAAREPGAGAAGGWLGRLLPPAAPPGPGLDPEYDVVSLLIGVNNQFQGRPIGAYEPEFATLLKVHDPGRGAGGLGT